MRSAIPREGRSPLIFRRYRIVQGVFSGVLGMYSFDQRMASLVNNTGKKGWFVAILELGAWFGVLCTGYLADRFSRKYTIVMGASMTFLRRSLVFWVGGVSQGSDC